MSDLGDNLKYKWTPESTSLLVSVWSDRQVQKQLECATKPQLIWESVAKYMRRKGYEVTAKQCRSRMKQVLVCYKEAKKTGTRAGVERYYESIDKVLENKRLEKGDYHSDGTDTVDSHVTDFVPVLMKSPMKDMKTNKNLQTRQNELQDRPISLTRHIEVVPGIWPFAREECADSSESNETVMARPQRSLSPMKNVGTNTVSESMRLPGKSVRRSLPTDDRFRWENFENNRFSEIPIKNSVQNVQNQIIQENMMLRNQIAHDNGGMYQTTDYPINIHNPGPRPLFLPENIPQDIAYHPNRISTNMIRMQSQLQQYSLGRNGAMPQEPRKLGNLGNIPLSNMHYRRAYNEPYTADIAPNINDAFCHTTKNGKAHNLNETFDRSVYVDADEAPCQIDATTLTNNATFNDDTLSIDFIQDSPSPSDNNREPVKAEVYDNGNSMPDVPVRKKKAQKLEQLMLNAITSQTEVVNKILAAQDSMVNRILDLDQDRQNRMENRLDQLMNVVQATVMNKSSESNKESEAAQQQQQQQQQAFMPPVCFSPPPRPGTMPPKLDLVPPKPCRVPCINPPRNTEMVNQDQIHPETKPLTRPGTIWSRLGPVSQSPFVKAQQQIFAVKRAADHWRTISSAERRILTAQDPLDDPRVVIQETKKLIESEKLMEERIENARRLLSSDNDKTADQSARRQLFQPEKKIDQVVPDKVPSADVILTSTFLKFEREAEDKLRRYAFPYEHESNDSDELLTGQGESYDRLRRLSLRVKPKRPTDLRFNMYDNQMDTSTPAKNTRNDEPGNRPDGDYCCDEPRQTIQQLAELVMNSARWRNPEQAINQQLPSNAVPGYNNYDLIPMRPARDIDAQRQSRDKALNWLQDQYAYGKPQPEVQNDHTQGRKNYPMGFVNPNMNIRDERDLPSAPRNPNNRGVEFTTDNQRSREFVDNERRQFTNKYGHEGKNRGNAGNRGDEEDDDEFLDTTTTLHNRKSSLTSGTSTGSKIGGQCVIS